MHKYELLILDLFLVRWDSSFERYAMKCAKIMLNFRDFSEFSTLELGEG